MNVLIVPGHTMQGIGTGLVAPQGTLHHHSPLPGQHVESTPSAVQLSPPVGQNTTPGRAQQNTSKK